MHTSAEDPINPVFEKLGRMRFLGRSEYFTLEDELHTPQERTKFYNEVLDRSSGLGNSPLQTEVGVRHNAKEGRDVIQQEVYTSSITDKLTELPNRKGLEIGATRILHREKRHDDYDEKPVAVAVMDINKFKTEANDKYGHSFGDDILRYVTAALTQFTRDTDLVSRTGGDEFVLIFDGIQKEKAYSKLTNLVANVNMAIQTLIEHYHPGKLSPVSMSAGLVFSDQKTELGPLLEKADKAMYHAKTTQDAVRVHVYDPTLDSRKVYLGQDQQTRR